MYYVRTAYHTALARSSLAIRGFYWTISRVEESWILPEDTAGAVGVSGRSGTKSDWRMELDNWVLALLLIADL